MNVHKCAEASGGHGHLQSEQHGRPQHVSILGSPAPRTRVGEAAVRQAHRIHLRHIFSNQNSLEQTVNNNQASIAHRSR